MTGKTETGSPFLTLAKDPKPQSYTKVLITEGATITKPKDMPWDDAIKWMENAKLDASRVVGISRKFERVPWEVGVCLRRVVEKMFGMIHEGQTNEFQYIDVETSYSTKEKGMLGVFTLPGISGKITHSSSFQIVGGRFVLQSVLSGEIKKGDAEKLELLFEAVAKELKDHPIYKGQAFDDQMKFMDLSKADPDKLIFDESEKEQIRANIWTPIMKQALVRKAGIPIKRGVLLYGPYGCGKTQTAYCTAKIAAEHGFTFVLTNALNFVGAFKLAAVYAPAVVFVEDIDEIVSGTERTTELNQILNTVDGVEGKDKDIVVIYTTNHIEKLNRAMLRPGRLDALIHLKPPSPVTVLKFFELYGRGLLPDVSTLDAAAGICAGMIPAMLREVVERSKLYAISRGNGEAITTKDVELAATQLHEHRLLLNGDVKNISKHVRILAEIKNHTLHTVDGTSEHVQEEHSHQESI